MKRPPVLRPRLVECRADAIQNRSLERIIQSSRNNSVEHKERASGGLWNVLGYKSRAHSINKENSFSESKSSRESLNYVKENLKRPLMVSDAYPRTHISVSTIKNSFYSTYEHAHVELEKFERVKKNFSK